MTFREIIKQSGLTQQEAADAIGVALYTLRMWLREGIPNEPAGMAWMWYRGLAEPIKTDAGWTLRILEPASQSEVRAIEILGEAFRKADAELGGSLTGARVKNDPPGLTNRTSGETVPDMRSGLSDEFPNETANKQVNVLVFPSLKKEAKALAEQLGESLGEFVRKSIHERSKRLRGSDS